MYSLKLEKDNYSESEDWVLQRLFKRAGLVVETAVDQNCVTKGSDYRRIDLEAQQVKISCLTF